MSNILLLRDRSTSPEEGALLEQQAILAITRSILAGFTTEGMIASQHKIILPVHLDLLPLLAFVADDYAEFTEPEPERRSTGAPFILYRDDNEEYQAYEQILHNLMHPNWFITEHLRHDLREIIRITQPAVCILVGEARQKLEALRGIDHRFQQMIGFSMFLRGDIRDDLRSMAESVTMADNKYTSMLQESMRRMDADYENLNQFSVWESLFIREERRPELEPLMHFGAAAEMALFPNNG